MNLALRHTESITTSRFLLTKKHKILSGFNEQESHLYELCSFIKVLKV